MNSDPSLLAGYSEIPSTKSATPTVSFFLCITPAMIGRYTQIKKRFTGFLASGMILPRMNSIINTGTSVTESIAAPAMAKVLV